MPDLLSTGQFAELVQDYGLWVLFVVVMLESAAVPVPGETLLITAALYAGSTGQIGIGSVIAVAATAAIVGDNIGYAAGRWVGLRVLVKFGRYVHLDEKRLKIGQYLFRLHGGKIVFFGRFVAFLRAFAAILAGVNRMAWPRFLLMNALGGVCWAGLIGGGAYLLGENIERAAGPLGLLLLAGAAGLAVAGAVFFRRHENELAKRAQVALADHGRAAEDGS